MDRHRARLLALIVGLLVVGLVGILPQTPFATTAVDILVNGGFEVGFGPDGVASGWQRFDNGGPVSYAWVDETWPKAVAEGSHAQLIIIDSTNWFPTQADRYAGIYQTVVVIPGQTYQLTIRALIRTTEGNATASGYGYRVQYGVDPRGGRDWRAVAQWVDLGVNQEYPVNAPGQYAIFTTAITASSDRLTLFIRAWKKWAHPNRVFLLDIDAVSLKGPAPTQVAAVAEPPVVSFRLPPALTAGQPVTMTVDALSPLGIRTVTLKEDNATVVTQPFPALPMVNHTIRWTPAGAGLRTVTVEVTDMGGRTALFRQTITVGEDHEFVRNGSFEEGFAPDGVAQGWSAFRSGGRVNIGFFPEGWPKAVFDGASAQLIYINSLHLLETDPHRTAGIYQVIAGLTPGAPYRLTIRGLMRTTEADARSSGYGYRVEYGIDERGRTDPQVVAVWHDLGFNREQPVLAPEAYETFATMITPSTDRLTLFIRGVKKWATPFREFLLDLDGVSLRGYR